MHRKLNKFRMECAEQKLACTVKARDSCRREMKSDETIGIHLPFGIIVKKEGGWRAVTAIRAAVTRVMKCLVLKAKIVTWNSMTDRIEFLFTRTRHFETFERIWAERTQMKELATSVENLSGSSGSSKALTDNKEDGKGGDKPTGRKAKVARTESKEMYTMDILG